MYSLIPEYLLPRNMAKNAVTWAKQRGLNRVNPVHQEEEYRVPTDWTFSNLNLESTTTTASSSTTLQAFCG